MTKYFHLTFWGCPDVKIRHPKKKKNSLLITLSTRVFLSNFVILKMWQFFSKKLGRIYTRKLKKFPKLPNWVVKEVTKICWKK
jgi:hypothetical protein